MLELTKYVSFRWQPTEMVAAAPAVAKNNPVKRKVKRKKRKKTSSEVLKLQTISFKCNPASGLKKVHFKTSC